MTAPRRLEQSRAYPVEVPRAYARVLAAPLEQVFSRRYLALPAVREVRDQAGAWGAAGQTRTVVLADGGTMREELTSVDEGSRFAYRIGHVTGPMKTLVGSLDGTWSFDPVGTGTRVTWTWTVHPASAAAGLAMPVFARLWHGYARQALDDLEGLLLGF
jgi:hypothetical protein